ncbi:MAG: hypothetical protein FWC47_15150 [Oscillospiraceae bacterium]|nr:hypothetical protein [Oscillospiraceae bacterium]
MENTQKKLLKKLYKQCNYINGFDLKTNKTIKKEYKSFEDDVEGKIFKMYANGSSIDEIEEYLNIIYGSKISNILINRMIDKIWNYNQN